MSQKQYRQTIGFATAINNVNIEDIISQISSKYLGSKESLNPPPS
jgi:hypothetical protein